MKILNRELYNVKELLDSDWLIFTHFHFDWWWEWLPAIAGNPSAVAETTKHVFLTKTWKFLIVELLELTLWNYWNGCFSLTLTIISEWIWIQDCISIYYLWEFRRGIQLMYANGTNEVNMIEDWIGWFSLIFTLLRYENDCQSTARVDCMLEKARKAVASLDLVIYSALNG
jgi:hypothetical protein